MKQDYDPSYFLGILRLCMGWIFLWAFLDKLLGLGYSTCRAASGTIEFMCSSAWINGSSPTEGFLSHATQGPFAGIFQSMAGNPIVDWLFMLGLAFVGVTLLLGIFVSLGAAAGATQLFLMFLATLLPESNPLIDNHIIYALLMVMFIYTNAGKTFGLGKWWAKQSFVQKYPILM